MTEKFNMTDSLIPDGALRGQRLAAVSLDKSKYVLSFDIKMRRPDSESNEMYKKYSGFKSCKMVFHLKDDGMHEVSLQTAARQSGAYSGYLMTLRKFTEAIEETLRNPEARRPRYAESSVSNYAFATRLSIFPSVHQRLKKYCLCELSIAADSVEFIWE